MSHDPNFYAAVFTGVIAVATIAYVTVTAYLFRATERAAKAAGGSAKAAQQSADLARQAFFASHRPFVGISRCQLDTSPEPGSVYGKAMRVRFEARNYGLAPATAVELKADALLDGDPLAEFTEYPPCDILPGASVGNILQVPMGQESRRDIEELACELQVRVQVRYRVPGDVAYQHTARFAYTHEHREFTPAGSSTEILSSEEGVATPRAT
jgi:hypothetical protein